MNSYAGILKHNSRIHIYPCRMLQNEVHDHNYILSSQLEWEVIRSMESALPLEVVAEIASVLGLAAMVPGLYPSSPCRLATSTNPPSLLPPSRLQQPPPRPNPPMARHSGNHWCPSSSNNSRSQLNNDPRDRRQRISSTTLTPTTPMRTVTTLCDLERFG